MNSMRVGIVLKLRKAFEEVGRREPYTPATLRGDPTKSFLVQNYLTFKAQEQGEAGVLPKCAPCMMLAHFWNKKGLSQIKFAQRIANSMYAPNTIRKTNDRGLVFDKTLRMGSHCFGFVCVK